MCQVRGWARGLTLISLLLTLDPDCEILAILPVDLVALSMVVDEVTTVTTLVLVEVGLGEGLVGEVFVFGEVKQEAEARLVQVFHSDVGKGAQRTLIPVSDHLSQRNLVLHSGQPKLGNAGDVLCRLGGLLLLGLLGFIALLGLLLTLLDLIVGGLCLAVDDAGTLLVKRCELGEVLLLELKDLFLELGLKLGVFLLNTLQAGNAAADRSRQRLDVTGRSANE